MPTPTRGVLRILCLAAALGTIPALLAIPAHAAADLGGIGQTETIAVRAKVTALDLPSRMVTLVGPAGNSVTLKVGDEVHNLDQIKVGDTVVAHYVASIALILASPGTKIPDDSINVAANRAAKGHLPAGAISARAVVTDLVTGVDLSTHTLELVDPSGGQVRTVRVLDPQRQAQMKRVKVGDTITAVVTAALAISIDPAP